MVDDLLDRTEQAGDGFNPVQPELVRGGEIGHVVDIVYRQGLVGMHHSRGLGIYVVFRPWNGCWWPRDSPVRRQQGLVTARRYMTLPGSVVPLSLLNEKDNTPYGETQRSLPPLRQYLWIAG
jgi:hypothetical protein